MSCLPQVIPYQLKNTKIVQSPTAKVITISYAVGGITNVDQAISTLGVHIADPCPLDSRALANNITSQSVQGQSDTACIVDVDYIHFDFFGSPTQDVDGFNLSYSYNEALNQDLTNYAVAAPTVPLVVYYWPGKVGMSNKTASTQQQGCTIPVLKPYSTKIVKFYYTIPAGFPDDTLTELMQTVGFYNTDTWDSGLPKTWLCTGVTWSPVGLAQQVLVELSFYYKPETWLAWAFYTEKGNPGSPIGALKVLTDPDQTAGPLGSNGCAGFLPYNGQSFIDVYGFQ